MTSARPRRTRLDEALARSRQIARALAALSLDVDVLRPDRLDFEAERNAVRVAFNHERDELAALHDVMRQTLLRRYPDYRRTSAPVPGRLDAMDGFKPERVVENYRAVVTAGRESAERMASILESASDSYEHGNVLRRGMWRLGWSGGGYALYRHGREAALAVVVLMVVAVVAVAAVSLLRGGGDVQASAGPGTAGPGTAGTTANAGTTAVSGQAAAVAGPDVVTNGSVAVSSTTVTTTVTISAAASTTGTGAPIDIAGDPARDAIVGILEAGVIRLAPDDRGEVRFDPDRPVERREFLVWLDRALPIPASDRDVDADFCSDVDESLRSKVIDAYQSRIILQWAKDGEPVHFSPDSLLLPRDAVGWCVRAVIRALPAPSLAAALALTEVEAGDIRKDISTLSVEQVDRLAQVLGLLPAKGFAGRDSLTRGEAAGLLSTLQTIAEEYLE